MLKVGGRYSNYCNGKLTGRMCAINTVNTDNNKHSVLPLTRALRMNTTDSKTVLSV